MPDELLDQTDPATRLRFSIPRAAPRVVLRPRLFAALDEGSRRPLTLVSASAGTGKTALITSWLATGNPPGPVAWVTLDEFDNRSRARFWRWILVALGELGIDVGVDLISGSTEGAVDAALEALAAAIADTEDPVVLVLDDFGVIDNGAILADVYQLLLGAPAALRVIAAVRGTPSMRLQRMRLAGIVCEIGPDQLAFTLEESVELLANSGVTLDLPVAERLWQTTEGWGAGLQLAALALRAHERPKDFVVRFSGDTAPVSDYLLEEVLSHQTAELRDFLLQTSVVDRVCGPLADALTGGSSGGSMLAELHRSGTLTIALDERREWYRYHPLLLRMLRTTLRRDDPGSAEERHGRAARWLAGHGREPEAAHHAILAADDRLLNAIVLGSGVPLLVRGELPDLARVLRELPRETLSRQPFLALALAASASDSGDAEQAGRWLSVAQQAHADDPVEDGGAFAIGCAVVALHRARMLGDLDTAVEAARVIVHTDVASEQVDVLEDLRALALLLLGALELWTVSVDVARHTIQSGLAASAARGRPYLTLYGIAHLSMCHVWVGEYTEGERRAQEAIALAERGGWRNTPRTATAIAALGVVALARGDLESARHHLDSAERGVADWQDRVLRAHIGVYRARIDRMSGRPEHGAAALTALAPELAAFPSLAPLAEVATSECALAMAASGQPDAALELLRTAVATAVRAEVPVALARLLIDRGEHQAALDQLDGWADRGPGDTQWMTTGIQAWITQARALEGLGDTSGQRDALTEAVSLAATEDVRAPFMEIGDALVAPLRRLLDAGRTPQAFTRELIRAAGQPNAPLPDQPVMPTDALTERELTILRLLPTRMSNGEIGAELFLSINTVKTHVSSVFRKLDAHSRREAVSRARSLGLLSPGRAATRPAFDLDAPVITPPVGVVQPP
jgi:LuxR family maltose regulon positive regulatory protein